MVFAATFASMRDTSIGYCGFQLSARGPTRCSSRRTILIESRSSVSDSFSMIFSDRILSFLHRKTGDRQESPQPKADRIGPIADPLLQGSGKKHDQCYPEERHRKVSLTPPRSR